MRTRAPAFLLLAFAMSVRGQGLSSIKIPITVDQGNAIVPIVGSYETGATRSDGKWFSLINFYTHRLPTAFQAVSPTEWDQIRKAQPTRR